MFAAGLAIFGFYGQFRSQLFYISELHTLRPESPQIFNDAMLFGVTAVAVVGSLVTLVFMWQVRNSKNG